MYEGYGRMWQSFHRNNTRLYLFVVLSKAILFQFHVKESTGISNICEIFFKKLQLQFRQEHVTCRRILNSVVNKKR